MIPKNSFSGDARAAPAREEIPPSIPNPPVFAYAPRRPAYQKNSRSEGNLKFPDKARCSPGSEEASAAPSIHWKREAPESLRADGQAPGSIPQSVIPLTFPEALFRISLKKYLFLQLKRI